MEGSDKTPETKPAGRERKRAHVQYVVLYENKGEPGVNGWELIAKEDGMPRIWSAYRATDALSDAIEAGVVEPDDKGVTPYMVAVPARNWAPQRATIATQRKIKLGS